MSDDLQSRPERPKPERVNGRFAPGTSGNPGGKSRRTSDGRTVAQLFRDATEEAANFLRKVVCDENEPTTLRVQAAGVIAQRGWGDAPKIDIGDRVLNIVIAAPPPMSEPIKGVTNSPVREHIWRDQSVTDATVIEPSVKALQ